MELEEAIARLANAVSRSYIERKIKATDGEWHIKVYFDTTKPETLTEAQKQLEAFDAMHRVTV